MLKFLPYLVVVLAFCFASMDGMGEEEILFWQTDETTTVNGGNILTFLEMYPIDEDNWNAVRVVVSGGQLSEPVVLDIWYNNPNDPPSRWEDNTFGIEPDYNPGSGKWETGWVQSKIPVLATDEMLFQLEMGHNVWDYDLDDAIWTTIAVSDTATYDELRQQYVYETFDINPLTASAWNPNLHTVIPEPNSFILFSIGLSMLLLSRKRA